MSRQRFIQVLRYMILALDEIEAAGNPINAGSVVRLTKQYGSYKKNSISETEIRFVFRSNIEQFFRP